ncbi:hypothetical protein DWB84_12305 [Saccharophagus sp. K07]|jgi:hypothetical protein|uniref:hypothetical protein n=1 Tax=Saccharophagus sp. K07 TaxID=2283636 RepID=UPI00165243A1|nr:hypothetical protein [Saccharophagus sp. K07]MBC6906245.1 hypothetical protein [Saccharophagus sp. K07]
MSEMYIIRNQDHFYLSKQGEWVDGSDSHGLFRTAYKDEAINVKVELSVRDPHLRLTIVPGVLDEKGHLTLKGGEAIGPVIDQSPDGSFSSAATESADQAADHIAEDAMQPSDSCA